MRMVALPALPIAVAAALLAVAAVAVRPAPAQSFDPDTAEAAQETRAMAVAAAMKSGDADELARVLEANLVPEAWAERDPPAWAAFAARLTGDFSGIDVAGVIADDPNALQLRFSASDRLPAAAMEFQFEPTEPYRIRTFEVRVGGPAEPGADTYPPFDPSTGAGRAAVFAQLDAYLAGLAGEDLFSGVVLVALDGKPLYTRAHGLASIRHNAPNTPETRFDLGSINKDFTRVAIGQLLEQGKVRLTDTVADLLPEYPNREVARQITVQQLLSHTSGLGDMFTETFEAVSRGGLRDLADYLALFTEEPLLFEPGKGTSYSNAGYITLGLIIERLSGMSYQDYVAEHVFRPAGMTNAGFFARDGIDPRVADGYTRWYTGDPDAPWRSNVYMLPARGNSAGSAQATAADLLAYDNAIREHRLLTPPYTRWFFGGPVPAPGETGGDTSRSMAGVGIAGGAPGVTAAMESDGRIAVIVLGNIDEPMAEAILQRIYAPLERAFR